MTLPTLVLTREYIQERNPTDVENVEKVLVRVQVLLYIREPTLERNLIIVENVGKALPIVLISVPTGGSTLVRTPTNVLIVKKVSIIAHDFENIGECILERNLMDVSSVANVSVRVLLLPNIRKFI